MADAFSCDPDQAQQLAEKLLARSARISSNRSPGPSTARAGTGVIEGVLAEFGSAMSAAQDALAASVDNSASNFLSLTKGVTTLDHQEAERI